MGTSRSPDELAAKLGRLAGEYQDLPLTLVKESSFLTKTSIKGIAPARLRGVGKKGAKLDVRYNVGSYGDDAKSLVFATGPWQLIERSTRAHRIPRVRASARAKRRVVVIPSVGVRASANHPGAKGQHPWRKGVEAAQPAVRRLFETRSVLPLRRVF